MPLLAPTQNVQPTQEVKIAHQASLLIAAPNQVKNNLISAYKQAHSLMWGNQGEVTPAQRIAKLNETAAAAELLAIEAALFAFLTQVLAQQDSGALAEVTALHEAIPSYTVTPDGIVTLTQTFAQQDVSALAEVTALHEAISSHTVTPDGTVTLD